MIIEAGIYSDLSNKEYHASNGISNSGLGLIADDPASYIWNKEAPRDKEKLKALDFGTDFHAYFLEPDEFAKNYQVMPKFNRRKKDEKEAELMLIEKWEEQGITAVTDEDMKKLSLMRESAMSHPTVKSIMAMNGKAEQSIYWMDDDIQEICKCRPDWMVTDIDDTNRPAFMNPEASILIADVKTTAGLKTIQKSIAEFRYHVQDQFYTNGVETAFKGEVVDFIFIFVSTTANCGRYPVKVVRLAETAKFDGRTEYKQNLQTYKRHVLSNNWETISEEDLPQWAIKTEDLL